MAGTEDHTIKFCNVLRVSFRGNRTKRAVPFQSLGLSVGLIGISGVALVAKGKWCAWIVSIMPVETVVDKCNLVMCSRKCGTRRWFEQLRFWSSTELSVH
jgi:hypothetical protein